LDGHQKKVREALRIIKKYHDPIVQHRIKQWNDGLKIHEEDWLDVLISLKDSDNNPSLTFEEISAQIIVIYFTSLLLCFSVVILARKRKSYSTRETSLKTYMLFFVGIDACNSGQSIECI